MSGSTSFQSVNVLIRTNRLNTFPFVSCTSLMALRHLVAEFHRLYIALKFVEVSY